jgi:predicted nucleic acid-binding protein
MAALILLDTSALLTLRDDEPLKALPLQWVEASEPLLQRAAGIKACHSLSLADAWIAASAQQIGATLLHKDPEFRGIATLSQEWLA